jgi:hypothetical protein
MSGGSEVSAPSLACVADRIFSPPTKTTPTMPSKPLRHARGPTPVSHPSPIVPADTFSSRSQQCVPSSPLEPQDANLLTGPASSPPAPQRRSTSTASAQEGPSASAYKKAGDMLAKRLALREQEQEQERHRQKAEQERRDQERLEQERLVEERIQREVEARLAEERARKAERKAAKEAAAKKQAARERQNALEQQRRIGELVPCSLAYAHWCAPRQSSTGAGCNERAGGARGGEGQF